MLQLFAEMIVPMVLAFLAGAAVVWLPARLLLRPVPPAKVPAAAPGDVSSARGRGR